MKTRIEIIRLDEENHQGEIIALRHDKVVIDNKTLGKTQEWDLEDLKQCIKFM